MKDKGKSVWLGLSWIAFIAGVVTVCIGIYNMGMAKSVQGYYLQSMLMIILASFNLQKSLYDKGKGVESVTTWWLGISWGSLLLALVNIFIGIYNLDAALSVKGFYFQSVVLLLVTSFNLQKVLQDSLMEDKSVITKYNEE